jgi:hypothetical protein
MDLFRRNTKPPANAAKGYFRPKAQVNLETVTAKLQAVEAEIATAEAELSKVSLAAVLADDQTGFQAVSSLNELRTRRELLQHALGAATAAENARLNELRSKADKAERSRPRSAPWRDGAPCRQHRCRPECSPESLSPTGQRR